MISSTAYWFFTMLVGRLLGEADANSNYAAEIRDEIDIYWNGMSSDERILARQVAERLSATHTGKKEGDSHG